MLLPQQVHPLVQPTLFPPSALIILLPFTVTITTTVTQPSGTNTTITTTTIRTQLRPLPTQYTTHRPLQAAAAAILPTL